MAEDNVFGRWVNVVQNCRRGRGRDERDGGNAEEIENMNLFRKKRVDANKGDKVFWAG
jgi:hypothetical protein